MARDPVRVARQAFAMAARAELSEGQRAAAINRGMAILEKYGLDPLDFDIPGQPRVNHSAFPEYDFDHESPHEGIKGTSFRTFRRWSGEVDPRDVWREKQEAAERAAREERLEQAQRDARWKARVATHELGRGRMSVTRGGLA